MKKSELRQIIKEATIKTLKLEGKEGGKYGCKTDSDCKKFENKECGHWECIYTDGVNRCSPMCDDYKVGKDNDKKKEMEEQRINTHYKGNCCEWCDDLAAGRAIGNYPPEGCQDLDCNDCPRGVIENENISKLKNLIKTSLKEIINEQMGAGTKVNARTCDGSLSLGNFCVPNSAYPNGIQIGDHFKVTQYFNQSTVGRQVFVRNIMGSCNAIHNGIPVQVQPETSCCRNCSNSYGWQSYQQNFGGACTTSCGPSTGGPTPTSGCDPNGPFPGNFNLQSWTNTWTSLPNFSSSNPNQPCNFVCQRKNQWTNQLAAGGMGPAQTNMVECRLAEAINQYQIHGCATSNANNCP